MSELPALSAIDRHVVIRVVEDGKVFADPIFLRRYRSVAPDFPHHVLAFYRADDGSETPVCYIHFTVMGDYLLGGGACVDDRVLRRMNAAARAAIREAGGLYQYTLSWAVRHFSSQCLAIFGYCGDALAERADLAVGFTRTSHPKLLVYFTRDLETTERDRLIAEANAVGPF
jgi:hypothetical protein